MPSPVDDTPPTEPAAPATPPGEEAPAAPVAALATVGAQRPDAASHGIVVRRLHRAFGPVKALDGIDLVARPGAVTALVGPNGSGKTTLLLVLAGLLVPDAGEVRVAGHDPVADGPQARARTGWMPDAFGTWDSLTAREVLLTFAAASWISPSVARRRVDELLATVHLSEFADRHASVLSRGQKQRLGLARALVHDPQVLLLDEPASGLDPRSRVDLRLLLRDLADQGRTILVSSHVLTELEEMADDAVFVSRGRTVTDAGIDATVDAPRAWRVRALSLAALTRWLTSVGAAWSPDDGGPDNHLAPPTDGPGAVLVQIAGDDGAATLIRDAVAAGVPLVSVAPAGGVLEQAYLALDEERR
ncbi:ABC transporter ATP-binding protein [Cellulomonas soli]|uniref:Multidrug ABC transporter ATP-binding protein n=1 Tax=Cellulomonas soli TaxID=931535 RepID=A0A512PHS5_9CELL|nr:ABC transporter ATP-binding protein [Cellulomonas soli]NYI59227.1 ABC-type multidrug transport system ATPase subunit [Cellulomonas soli]GEP70733.1 multidrug ABC transporter ATP-binding protein [Cellulomonas soli]